MTSFTDDIGGFAREHNSVLAARERRLLISIGGQLPASLTPDRLTIMGVVGGALVGLGCIASHLHLGFLWLAVAGLLINWFGDSLDGSVARVRGIERPRYGFFVDQFSDVSSHFMMLIGMGLSPLMRLDTALLALLGSLLVMFYGHLKLPLSRTWQVSHSYVGPTELRILIAAGMMLVFFVGMPVLATPAGPVTLFDAVAVLVFVGAVVCVLDMFRQDRAKLAMMDPPRTVEPAEVDIVQIPAPAVRVSDMREGAGGAT